MFRGRFLGTLLALMIIVGLFSLASSSIYRAGWTQGYFTGKTTDAAETGTVVVTPEGATGQVMYPSYSPFGSLLGGIFKFFFFFMVIGFFFKMFLGLIFWRKRGLWDKHWKGGHDRHWHNGWGHRPPWFDDAVDEPVMKV